jgi:DNA-binding transcriptional LysR family regulator
VITLRQAAVLAVPAVVVLAAAAAVGSASGWVHLAAAGVAVGLCVPPAFGTFWLTRWLAARHPLGMVIGMAVGVAARLFVAFAGGAVVFVLTGPFREMTLGYWLWLLFAYLTTLSAETALLARHALPAAGGPPGGKG